jgi:cardiolipin synthase
VPPGASTVVIGSDSFRILPDTTAYEAELFDLVRSARRTVHVLVYIYMPDASGRRFLDVLVEAARRGVRVVLLVDALGASRATNRFFRPLTQAGGTVERFHSRLDRNCLVRTHQKMMVGDGARAVIGGFNIGNQYFGPLEDGDFRELGLAIAGSSASRLAAHVDELLAMTRAGRTGQSDLDALSLSGSAEGGAVRLLFSGPGPHGGTLLDQLRADIGAGSHASVVAAYLMPDEVTLRLLCDIATRGSLLVVGPGRSDLPLVRPSAWHIYGPLLEAGARIAEFDARPLHAKLIVVDDVVYFGSSNLDLRSLFINLELMVRIESPELADQARCLVESLAERSTPVTRERYARRGLLLRRAGWLLATILLSRIDFWLYRLLCGGRSVTATPRSRPGRVGTGRLPKVRGRLRRYWRPAVDGPWFGLPAARQAPGD